MSFEHSTGEIGNALTDPNTQSRESVAPPPSEAGPRIYYYSPADNAFYLSDELSLFEAAGNLPLDLVPVAESIFQEFALDIPPAGKTRAANATGFPCWIDEPPLPDEVLRARNIELRNVLLRSAAERISPLQDAVDLEIATDDEAAALIAWKKYRVQLNRMDQQEGYPLTVAWPSAPNPAE